MGGCTGSTQLSTTRQGPMPRCSALTWSDPGAAGSYTGEFEYLTSYTAAGYGAIRKSAATLATPGLETEVGFGADAVSNEYFKVHLHAAPCSSDGGGVSRSDPTRGAVCPALPWRCCV